MSETTEVDVSIILPCRNEASILEASLRSIVRVMNRTTYRYEILVVDDASTDGTGEVADALCKTWPGVTCLRPAKRLGKGASIAMATQRARGVYCGFIDADLEAPAYYIPVMVAELEDGADLVSAHRVYQLKRYQFFRFPKYLAHIGYKWLFGLFLHVPIADPGSGCKFYRRTAILPLLSRCQDTHWFWDTELIVKAWYQRLRVHEVPALFIPDDTHESKVRIFADSWEHLCLLWKLRREMHGAEWQRLLKESQYENN